LAGVAVIWPLEKAPLISLLTIDKVLVAAVAALARLAPAATLAAVTAPTVLTIVAPWVPVMSPANTPVKEPADAAVVAVLALPIRVAVMVPALKLPPASRLMSVEAVFASVEALARSSAAWILAAVEVPTVLTMAAPGYP